MNDRFKFKAVLKTSEFTILVKPYYILEDSYFIDINQAEAEFKNKYPEECFWDLIDEIEKQDYVQEISSDNDLIITKDFTNLIQCTGLKDKNGTLIYEGDILKINTHFNFLVPDDFEYKYESEKGYSLFKVYYNEEFARYEMKRIKWVKWETEHKRLCNIHTNHIIIGNIYENAELLEE